MDFEFRFGQEADAHVVADLVIAAGDGLFESMLDDIVPGVGARQFVRMAVISEDSPLNYANAVLVENGGDVVGMALCYPSAQYGLHPVLNNLVPNRRLAPLTALFSSKIEDSWYLNSLVVVETARNLGLGKLLVEFCADLGAQMGLSSMSLHVWAENEAALAMYRGLGFRDVASIPVALRVSTEHKGGMLLMTAPLPLVNDV